MPRPHFDYELVFPGEWKFRHGFNMACFVGRDVFDDLSKLAEKATGIIYLGLTQIDSTRLSIGKLFVLDHCSFDDLTPFEFACHHKFRSREELLSGMKEMSPSFSEDTMVTLVGFDLVEYL